MSKKNNERKEKIKSLLLKTLHVICYILSIAFIGICVFSGVQSCQKSNRVNAESSAPIRQLLNVNNQSISDYLDEYDLYYFNLNNPTFSGSFMTDLLTDFGLPTEAVSTNVGTVRSFRFYFNSPSYVLNNSNNEIYSTSFINYDFAVYRSNDDNNIRFWCLKLINFNYNDELFQLTLNKNVADANDLTYTTYDYTFLFSNSDVWNITSFYRFFKLADKSDYSDFSFNQQFNYNAPMAVSVSSPYGAGVIGGVESSSFTTLTYDTGWFLSNGQLFNQIQLWYQKSDGLTFDFNGTFKNGPRGMWSYSFMYYVNTYSNIMTTVNRRDIKAIEHNNAFTYGQLNSSTWVVDQYRYIKFLTPLSDSLKDNINQFNNNNYNYSNGSISGSSDIFTLLSMAFTSLIPFLSTNILPSISIGVLLFLPTIVGIIVIIFNLLRK